MTTGTGPATLPTTVVDADEWEGLTSMITQRTGLAPATDLEAFGGFVGRAAAVLFEAASAGNLDLLRPCFSSEVVAQFGRFPIGLDGCTGTGVVVRLLAAPKGPDPVVRIRVDIRLTDEGGHPGAREHFWDVRMDGTAVVVGAATCGNCGATLPAGALVCGYCHADTRRSEQAPLLVTKLERMS